jgi:hypothetical protein
MKTLRHKLPIFFLIFIPYVIFGLLTLTPLFPLYTGIPDFKFALTIIAGGFLISLLLIIAAVE